MPHVAVTISRSRSGPIYAGTEFVLTADISLSVVGVSGLEITWRRGNDVVHRDIHNIVSDVNGASYRSSLTYSAITISDSGQITATLTVTVSSLHVYLTATGTESLNVQGIHTCTVRDLSLDFIFELPQTFQNQK